MTPKPELTIHVDADEAARQLQEAADRIEHARSGTPPSRWDWTWWIVAVVGCVVAVVSSSLNGNGLAAAGWAAASWVLAGLGPKGPR